MQAKDARGGEWTIRWRGPAADYKRVHYSNSVADDAKTLLALPLVLVQLVRRSIVRRRAPSSRDGIWAAPPK